MGNELDKNYYNDRFSVGGHNQRYFRDAEDINDWYPSWKTAYDYVIKKQYQIHCRFRVWPRSSIVVI